MRRNLPPSEAMNKALQILLNEGTEDGHGVEGLLSELIRRGSEALLQQSLEAEVTDFLGRDRYERTDEEAPHRGYRNGYRRRHLKTSEGTLRVEQPRLRQTAEPFESRLLNSLGRIEARLERLALELYVRGLSTRDIEEALVDQDGRALLSRSSVSRLSEALHAEYEAFAARDLSAVDVVYLFVDGVYEAVRAYTNHQAILCAWAILADGTKTLIHLEAAESESRAAWEAFLEGLLARGMPHPLLVVHDGAPALKAALTRHLPQSDRQRCLAHKLRNLTAKMPHEARAHLLAEIKAIYYGPDQETAELLAERFIAAYAGSYPAVVRCFQDDLAACLVHLRYPLAHRKFIRTTNLLERAFVEEKRRTKVIPQHVNERGALKLVFAVLVRASARWRRVKMTPLELVQLRTIRQTMCPEPGQSETISFRLAA